MAFVSFIIILAILLVFASDKGAIKKGIQISFWLIVAVFSLRYGYGNDFFSYQYGFNGIAKYTSLYKAVHEISNTEIGWIIICYLCKPLGYQFLVAISTFVLCYIYYYLICSYVPKPYRWLGTLLFLMYPNLFLLDLSMIRQGLAGAFFILSFCKGYEKKWLHSVAFCLLAISIHQVSLICIPFILMINLKEYLNPARIMLAIVTLFLFLLYDISYVGSFFWRIMSTELVDESYSGYSSIYEGSGKINPLSMISRIVVIIPSLIWYKNLKDFDKYLTIMFCITPFTLLLATQNFLLYRLECFFLPFSVLIFPRLLRKDYAFEQRPKKWIITQPTVVLASMGWILFTIRSFFNFFSEPTYAKYYAVFHSIFSDF